jgi:hypothetical protein
MQAKVWAILIVVFSALDAYLTLRHLHAGGTELNPLMRYVLAHGAPAFMALKIALPALCVAFMVYHQDKPYVTAGLKFAGIVYAILMAYHLLLIILRLCA